MKSLSSKSSVAISAFPGNTSDPKTLLHQVEQLQDAFNLTSVVLVGDRGMISQKQVDELKGHSGVEGWMTALKTGAIRKLVDAEAIQLTLFDKRNLFEFTHPDFPGEKLVACRNPDLAYRRKRKREALLKATTEGTGEDSEYGGARHSQRGGQDWRARGSGDQ